LLRFGQDSCLGNAGRRGGGKVAVEKLISPLRCASVEMTMRCIGIQETGEKTML
jgi:hypothetical protein